MDSNSSAPPPRPARRARGELPRARADRRGFATILGAVAVLSIAVPLIRSRLDGTAELLALGALAAVLVAAVLTVLHR